MKKSFVQDLLSLRPHGVTIPEIKIEIEAIQKQRYEYEEAELFGRSAESRARTRERARCAAIIDAGQKSGNLALAAHFAFQTSLPRGEAIEALWEAEGSSGAAGYDRSIEPANGHPPSVSWDQAFRPAKH